MKRYLKSLLGLIIVLTFVLSATTTVFAITADDPIGRKLIVSPVPTETTQAK